MGEIGELWSRFFDSSSVSSSNCTTDDGSDYAAKTLLDKMCIPSYSGTYFNLLKDIGVPFDTVIAKVIAGREEILNNCSQQQMNMEDFTMPSTAERQLPHPFRFRFNADNFPMFFHLVFTELRRQPSLVIALHVPHSMKMSGEIVFERMNNCVTVNFGHRALESHSLMTAASKVYRDMASSSNPPLFIVDSSPIIMLVRSIVMVSEKHRISGSRNLSLSSGKLLTCRVSCTKLIQRIKLGTCKSYDYVAYIEEVYESVRMLFEDENMPSCAFAPAGTARELLADYLQVSKIKMLRWEILTCGYLIPYVYFYLATDDELSNQVSKGDLNLSDESRHIFSEEFLEKCCFILLFAHDNDETSVKNRRLICHEYFIKSRKFLDNIRGCVSRNETRSLIALWRATVDVSDTNQNITKKYFLLQTVTNGIQLKWSRIQRSASPHCGTSRDSDSAPQTSPHTDVSSLLMSIYILIDRFFSLCCCVLRDGSPEEGQVVLAAVIALLQCAGTETPPTCSFNDQDASSRVWNQHGDYGLGNLRESFLSSYERERDAYKDMTIAALAEHPSDCHADVQCSEVPHASSPREHLGREASTAIWEDRHVSDHLCVLLGVLSDTGSAGSSSDAKLRGFAHTAKALIEGRLRPPTVP